MNKLLTELCEYLKVKPQYLELLNERDMSDVWRQFAIWLLVDEKHGVLRFTNPGSLQYKAIQHVADLYIEDCKDADAWRAAAYTAEADSAKAAATHAAKSAAYAAADAAWSAAACRAADAAWSAAATASSVAEAYAAAAAAATHAAYDERMADKLIELINAAPLMK